MADETYTDLRVFLDQFPLGFPETKSGVEIKILKRLFSEEEAQLTVKLSLIPEDINDIADRIGMDADVLGKKLNSMARQGLIFKGRRKGKTVYRAIPYVVGLYEYSVKKVDQELAAFFKEYYDEAYLDEIGAINIPGLKVIPIEESIGKKTEMLPYHKLKENVREAAVIAVTECMCRKEARILGEACEHSLETCLTFGSAAEYYIESGLGRKITVEEAFNILEDADKAGLVHTGANFMRHSNICNCCPCCCAFMKGITQRGYEKHKFLNSIFEAVVEESECISCENCLDRCPVKAITVEDVALINRDKCLGCGLCAGVCSTGAITLVLREDREEPFDKPAEMAFKILAAKGKLA